MFNLNTKFQTFLCLIAGALLPLAFDPFGQFYLAYICPTLLLLMWFDCPEKKAAFRGFLFGLGFFGVGVSWVYISIHEFGNTNAPLAAFITLLLIIILSIFPAMQGFLLSRYLKKTTWKKCLLAFPASWVLFESLRGWLFTGFPWLFLSHSQTHSPLKSLIPLLGDVGTSFIIVLTAGTLALFIHSRKIKILLPCLLIWAGAVALTQVSWTSEGREHRVSMIQGNIPQDLKWSPEKLQLSFDTYFNFTKQHWNNDLIIWPETAVPILKEYAEDFLQRVDLEAKKNKTAIITGLPTRASKDQYYNSIIALGTGTGQYNKQHLVPFGEYVPFGFLLRGLIGFFDIPISDFKSGATYQENLKVNDIRIAPFICYEIAYASETKQRIKNSEVIITLSNDSWFGDSFAPAQHLQIAKFRALQTGRYILFSTNNGITAIINDKGQITQQIPQFTSAVLEGTFKSMYGHTPWTMTGDGLYRLLIIAFLALAMI